MTAETRVAVRPEGGRKATLKVKAELVLALLFVVLLFAAYGFSELDIDYATSTRLTAAIQRIPGMRPSAQRRVDTPRHIDSKASASK